jgi:hypothetical protein
MGLFDLDNKCFKTAYAFKAMGEMLDTAHAFRWKEPILSASLRLPVAPRILVSNYAIPPNYKPDLMPMPPELQKAAPPMPDMSKVKFLPLRTDIVYRDNRGYNLTIRNLPWGGAAFSIKRYRISKTQDLDLVEEKSATGDSLNLTNAMAPDALDLIVLRRR